jgi:hypothetical protein
MSCRKRLLALERRGLIIMPPPRRERPAARELVPIAPVCVEGALADLGKVELICVTGAGGEISASWNMLMRAHHPLGNGPLCGAQLRYLIKSERHGWLGGLAFSAAAWRLQARDEYLGWSEEERRADLCRAVCNSRFLIVPTVRVANLASHVLGMSMRRLAADWFTHYGYRPWMLETFIGEGHDGGCYRAANWIEVGQTRGRGRQDASRDRDTGVKRVLLYPLEPKRFPKLGRNVMAQAQARAKRDWAAREFGDIRLDARLVKRTIEVARDFFARPTANIPQACGSAARAKAAYRLFAHDEVNMKSLLCAHYESSHERIRQEPLVLAVCDTTALNYSAHPATWGLGNIGSAEDGPIGLMVHETMVFTPAGVPLGLIDVQCWARDPNEFGKKHDRRKLPIEEKESRKWLDSFAATQKAQAACEQTQLVMVADRESDVYELFEQARGEKAQFLIRAEQSRCLTQEQTTLWPHMQAQTIAGEIDIQAGRREEQPARTARLTVRHACVELKPPADRRRAGAAPVSVWAIWAREESAPEGVEALDWMLLTTVPTLTFEDACVRLEWYAKRWGIEIYHRIMKSGCKIENRQLGAADRLEACLAIDMVVAWRIMHLVHLGRQIPDAACTAYFSDMQWKALVAFTSKKMTLPAKPPTLREAVRLVARLGGFLDRKSDGEPGAQTLWLGLQRLDDIAASYAIFASPDPPS